MINKCPKNDCIAQVFTAYCQYHWMCIQLVMIFKANKILESGFCSNGIFIKQRDYMKINYLFICRHTTLYQSKEISGANLLNWYHFVIFCEIGDLGINYAKFAHVFIACLTKMSCNFMLFFDALLSRKFCMI